MKILQDRLHADDKDGMTHVALASDLPVSGLVTLLLLALLFLLGLRVPWGLKPPGYRDASGDSGRNYVRPFTGSLAVRDLDRGTGPFCDVYGLEIAAGNAGGDGSRTRPR